MSDFLSRDYAASSAMLPPQMRGVYYGQVGYTQLKIWGFQFEHCVMLYTKVGTRFDRIGVPIDTAGGAGSIIRLGVRTPLDDGSPGPPIIDTTVAGDVSGFVTAVIDLIANTSILWLSITTQVVGPGPLLRGASGFWSPWAPMSRVGVQPVSYTAGALYVGGVTGALPQTFPNWELGSDWPYVCVRVAP